MSSALSEMVEKIPPRFQAVLLHQRELFYAKLDELQESPTYRGGIPNHVKQLLHSMYKESVSEYKLECCICLEQIDNNHLEMSKCGHFFCTDCFQKIKQMNK